MNAHSAAEVATRIGKSECWVKRHAAQLPHSRLGKTYFWTDADIEAILASARFRPAAQVPEESDARLTPITGRRPQRYDYCDDKCTVDCGHCKGAGKPRGVAS